jgi:haloalkane dehalogenase
MTAKALRTPEIAFTKLLDWPYPPKYIDDLKGFEDLRVHYIDEGSASSKDIFLCLHGQPTWSYLYRKMIPTFLGSEARVIAPDWLGFGRSDKPVHDETYTYTFHRNMILAFVRQLDLKNITLVVQDWGGLLGLTLPVEEPERFKRLLVMNTALATGRSAGKGFDNWRAYSNTNPDLDIKKLMMRTTPNLSQDEANAYSAPFPDISYKAGVRRFPQMVMTEPDMEGVEISKRALAYLRDKWDGESFMAVGMKDPVLGPEAMQFLQSQIRNCPSIMEISEGGHFVQEWGKEIAEAALTHWKMW